MGQIFPTASLHRDHSISYALVCEKELSHIGKNNGNPDLVCENIPISHVALNQFLAISTSLLLRDASYMP